MRPGPLRKFLFLSLLLAQTASLWAVPPQLPSFPPLKFKPSKAQRLELKNGLALYLLEDPELPYLQIQALIRTGRAYDPGDKIGLGELFAATLRAGGTQNYSADRINETLEYLGASIEASLGLEHAGLSASCLSKDLEKVLPIFLDILQNPLFESKYLEIESEADSLCPLRQTAQESVIVTMAPA